MPAPPIPDLKFTGGNAGPSNAGGSAFGGGGWNADGWVVNFGNGNTTSANANSAANATPSSWQSLVPGMGGNSYAAPTDTSWGMDNFGMPRFVAGAGGAGAMAGMSGSPLLMLGLGVVLILALRRKG